MFHKITKQIIKFKKETKFSTVIKRKFWGKNTVAEREKCDKYGKAITHGSSMNLFTNSNLIRK